MFKTAVAHNLTFNLARAPRHPPDAEALTRLRSMPVKILLSNSEADA